MKTEFKPKKILITGHQGFIGAWVSFALYSLGFELYGVDNRSSYGERLFDKANLKDIFIEEEIIDLED
jgi:nucleoside-diphosphate-sugar epimerase